MAFTNKTYLDQITKTLEAERPVLTLCLVAPLEVIAERLEKRAEREGRSVTEFERRRSKECAAAHRDPAFGPPIDATRPAHEIAEEIAEMIRPQTA
jgi:thymidylate kinase